jgi:hypothetical protein
MRRGCIWRGGVVRWDDQTYEILALLIKESLIHLVVHDIDMRGVHLELGVRVIPANQAQSLLLYFFSFNLGTLWVHLDILGVIDVWVPLKLGRQARDRFLNYYNISKISLSTHGISPNTMPIDKANHLISVNVRVHSHQDEWFKGDKKGSRLLILVEEPLDLD